MNATLHLIALFLATMTICQPFNQLQVLTDPAEYLWSIDISKDNHIIASGSQDNSTYIYLKSSNLFSMQQRITDSSSEIYVIDLTGDGKKLLVVEWLANIRIYENINNIFHLFQTIIPSNGAITTAAGAITDDQ